MRSYSTVLWFINSEVQTQKPRFWKRDKAMIKPRDSTMNTSNGFRTNHKKIAEENVNVIDNKALTFFFFFL